MIHLQSNNKQQVVTDGNPYLCEDCILGRPIERLDVQVSEFLYQPAPTPVNLSSCLCDAPLAFNSFSTILFDSSSSF